MKIEREEVYSFKSKEELEAFIAERVKEGCESCFDKDKFNLSKSAVRVDLDQNILYHGSKEFYENEGYTVRQYFSKFGGYEDLKLRQGDVLKCVKGYGMCYFNEGNMYEVGEEYDKVGIIGENNTILRLEYLQVNEKGEYYSWPTGPVFRLFESKEEDVEVCVVHNFDGLNALSGVVSTDLKSSSKHMVTVKSKGLVMVSDNLEETVKVLNALGIECEYEIPVPLKEVNTAEDFLEMLNELVGDNVTYDFNEGEFYHLEPVDVSDYGYKVNYEVRA